MVGKNALIGERASFHVIVKRKERVKVGDGKAQRFSSSKQFSASIPQKTRPRGSTIQPLNNVSPRSRYSSGFFPGVHSRIRPLPAKSIVCSVSVNAMLPMFPISS